MKSEIHLGSSWERIFVLDEVSIRRGNGHFVHVVVAVVIYLTAAQRRFRRGTGGRGGHRSIFDSDFFPRVRCVRFDRDLRL